MPAATPAPASQEQPGAVTGTIKSIAQGILVFMAIQTAFKYFGFHGPQGEAKVADPVNPGPGFAPVPAAGPYADGHYNRNTAEKYFSVPDKVTPIWDAGTEVDMQIYLSEKFFVPHLDKSVSIFNEEKIKIGDFNDGRSVSVDVPLPESTKNNGTLYAHIFVGKHGKTLDPRDPTYNAGDAYFFSKILTRYMPKKKVVKTKKLIGGSEEEEEEEVESVKVTDTKGPMIASYWHSNLTLDMVADNGVLQYGALPPPIRQHVVLEQTGARDKSGQNSWYYPIIYDNEFWQLKDHMIELNNTVSSVPLHINVFPVSFLKFQIFASMDYSFKQSANNPNPAFGQTASTGSELEEFKRVLIDTNIYLLGTTVFVTILHSIFEMLAFKNDISHWRNKKDNVGISVRTILANVFMQAVIFLYLLDNNENTSWMILIGQGFGILLEAWKITRMVNVRVVPSSNFIGYKISFEDKHKLSQLEQETKEYDEQAFKYLYWVAVPLLGAYAVYSLLYDTHKSWYSFIITTLVGSVYAYGFLMMVPSLYINYKLKSVAHMPRKTMVYKLLNTFIDDLFAFTIKMPTLHRLATLRDDVIYFIALYQSWVYRVDYRRVNEFGQGGDDEDEDKKEDEVEGGKEGLAEDVKVIEDTVKASGAQTTQKAGKKRR